jgi:hypothetical protein
MYSLILQQTLSADPRTRAQIAVVTPPPVAG